MQALNDFTETWNKYFAHPSTWTYRGEGLHGKVVRRFMRLLLIESPQMEIGFFDKATIISEKHGPKLLDTNCQNYGQNF